MVVGGLRRVYPDSHSWEGVGGDSGRLVPYHSTHLTSTATSQETPG